MTNPQPPVQRLRLCYSKKGDARYIGHLDVARFWERVFRRIDLPIAYTHGFNPQARIQFASALPVGIEADNELVDIWLLESVDPAEWTQRVARSLPTGFYFNDLYEVPLKLPAMQSSLRFAQYQVDFPSGLSENELNDQVQALLNRAEIIRPHHKQKGKTYDLRPLISDLTIIPTSTGVSLHMRLQSGPQRNARANEVIAALGFESVEHRITRTALLFDEAEAEVQEAP